MEHWKDAKEIAPMTVTAKMEPFVCSTKFLMDALELSIGRCTGQGGGGTSRLVIIAELLV